jgi:DNA-binding SARP family transcriptional activator
MPHLFLSFFGAFQAYIDDRPVSHFRSANAQGLLAYLALQSEKAFSRDVLAALFWPYDEESRARKNLRQTLYQLRQLLADNDDQPEPFLLVTRQTIQFNPAGNFTLDVQQFLSALATNDLPTAADLYQGELLAGFTSGGMDFEGWLRLERERLHRLALGAMETFARQQLVDEDWPAAATTARRQLSLEPWREIAHQQLMIALARMGERGAAIAQYATCVNALQVELGLEPSAETQALNAAITAGEYAPAPQPRIAPSVIKEEQTRSIDAAEGQESARAWHRTHSSPPESDQQTNNINERLFMAMKKAFSDRGEYERFLWFNFDLDIDDVVAPDDNMNDVHFKIIDWFEDRNQLPELVRQASAEREFVKELLVLSKEIDKLAQQQTKQREAPSFPAPAYGTGETNRQEEAALLVAGKAPETRVRTFLPPAGMTEHQGQKILLSKVKSFWIEGVLKQALWGNPALQIAREYVPTAVANPWQDVVPALNMSPQPVTLDKSVRDLFVETDRSLLILGDPGAGKTVLLLELARAMINEAETDIHLQIPVVFKLSSWANKELPLAQWVVEELNEKYLIPRKMGQEWLANNRLMLMLDGLDEVESDKQVHCVQAINDFRQANGLVPIALTSRTLDYEAINVQLRFGGAIRLRPLTATQADAYLRAANPHGAELVQTIAEDATLREIVQSPLMLQVLSKAFGPGTTSLSGRPGDRSEIRQLPKENILQILLETYVQQMFQHMAEDSRRHSEPARQWLSWLANRLSMHNQAIFLIEGMQPDWLVERSRRWQYLLITRLTLGLLIGLVLWLFGLIGGQMGVVDHSMSSLLIAGRVDVPIVWIDLVMSLLINLMYGLFVALVDIYFYERRLGRKRQDAEDWLRLGVIALVVGIVALIQLAIWGERPVLLVLQVLGAAFMFVLMVHFAFGQSYEDDIDTVEALSWSWQASGRGLFPAVLVGVAFSVVIWQLAPAITTLPQILFLIGVPIAILVLLLLGLRQNRIETKVEPNQGIRLSARNALTGSGLVGIVTGILATTGGLFLSGQGLAVGSAFGIFAGIVAALIGGLIYGGFNVYNHLVLRLLFHVSGRIPRDFVPFLNEAVRHVLLYRVGGGYIFIHRLLQEHLAQQDQTGGPPSDKTWPAVPLEMNESLRTS